jgi:type 1 glutamine amidotransferase
VEVIRKCSIVVLLLAAASAQNAPRKARVLCIGDTSTRTYQHASISHAMATVERLGRQSGLWDTVIRTDTQLLTKQRVAGYDGKTVNVQNLDDFDAIFFYSAGEPAMTDQQRQDLLTFVRDDGKGFVAAHAGNNAFYDWPEFGEMVGGRFDDHPWEMFDAPIVVEDPGFPAMKHFPREFTINDEIYQVKDFSRDKVRVVARLDASKLDLGNQRVHRTDSDFAVAWIRRYGQGRVFYSSLGHRPESWDRKDIQTMYLEAVKWALKLTDADTSPRPAPAFAP